MAKRDYDEMKKQLDEIIPHEHAYNFPALCARCAIVPTERINEVEFLTRLHDRHLTSGEILFLRDELIGLGLFESMA